MNISYDSYKKKTMSKRGVKTLSIFDFLNFLNLKKIIKTTLCEAFFPNEYPYGLID